MSADQPLTPAQQAAASLPRLTDAQVARVVALLGPRVTATRP